MNIIIEIGATIWAIFKILEGVLLCMVLGLVIYVAIKSYKS